MGQGLFLELSSWLVVCFTQSVNILRPRDPGPILQIHLYLLKSDLIELNETYSLAHLHKIATRDGIFVFISLGTKDITYWCRSWDHEGRPLSLSYHPPIRPLDMKTRTPSIHPPSTYFYLSIFQLTVPTSLLKILDCSSVFFVFAENLIWGI